jgi:hypothetical protein
MLGTATSGCARIVRGLPSPERRVDLRVADTIVGAGVVGTGKAVRVDPFRGAPMAFDRAPWRHRRMWRGGSGWAGQLQPAGRAILGRARLEPLDTGGSRGVLRWGDRSCRHVQASQSRHHSSSSSQHKLGIIGDLATRSQDNEDCRQDMKDNVGCQALSAWRGIIYHQEREHHT